MVSPKPLPDGTYPDPVPPPGIAPATRVGVNAPPPGNALGPGAVSFSGIITPGLTTMTFEVTGNPATSMFFSTDGGATFFYAQSGVASGHYAIASGLATDTNFDCVMSGYDARGQTGYYTEQVRTSGHTILTRGMGRDEHNSAYHDWAFTHFVTGGYYLNGDPWVLGPVTITSAVFNHYWQNNVRFIGGGMINPAPTGLQAFDDSIDDPDLKIYFQSGLDALAPLWTGGNPTIPVDSTLIQTDSVWSQPTTRRPIVDAAILTVVSGIPASGSFRPPYCTTGSKSWADSDRRLYNHIDYSILGQADITGTSVTTGWSETAQAGKNYLEKLNDSMSGVWIDFAPGAASEYLHPAWRQPQFGQDIAQTVGKVAMFLNSDFSTGDGHQDKAGNKKRFLMNQMIQLGIDNYGIIQAGGTENWPGHGGDNAGRKWPIVFAGLALNDPAMTGEGYSGASFSEDHQTFWVRETTTGSWNWGYGFYDQDQSGMVEWGHQHTLAYTGDDGHWLSHNPRDNVWHRTNSCQSAYWGQVIAAHMVTGMTGAWAHAPFFEYQDRYYRRMSLLNNTGYLTYYDDHWPYDVWEAHTGTYRDYEYGGLIDEGDLDAEGE